MGKFYGKIGYAETVETSPGVWTEVITERPYSGEILRQSRRLQPGEGLNDNLMLTNEISILADPFAYQNFHAIRYVEWLGTRWKVSTVDANQRPRLILTTGGVYNGDTPGTTDPA